MKGEFILKHINNDANKGYVLKFTPFLESEIKVKVNAVKFRKFMRHHVSASQYNAILKEFIQDLKIVKK